MLEEILIILSHLIIHLIFVLCEMRGSKILYSRRTHHIKYKFIKAYKWPNCITISSIFCMWFYNYRISYWKLLKQILCEKLKWYDWLKCYILYQYVFQFGIFVCYFRFTHYVRMVTTISKTVLTSAICAWCVYETMSIEYYISQVFLI